ncbi:hypothetical protein WK80_16170 [Burkholderia multivorans]|uniref:Uncharacterized protein n=1 Tax=Burkholderia multivorans TaxID=87883 RepID=A0AAP2HRG0_9BURK|nr:hypothetical protein [Burkholderia multivorans]KVV26198.1 hypothetical protein WK80_16170 [Burkholderia multivorans]MBU9360771.1 hypothetical protein [Burkholderia multivorans]MCO1459885.1 hypothetical protein [Burkholderia multivorans]UQO21296.1 hypothetical protein L0Z02_29685 [Burkholderia multivorans]HEM7843232.1 hypothetical protein [Burkholderia multivorans]
MSFQKEVNRSYRSTEEIESAHEPLHLQVDWHPSGRYTLKEGKPGRWSDCREAGLFANDDKGEFYRAVAKRLAGLANEGVSFVFNDVTYDRD